MPAYIHYSVLILWELGRIKYMKSVIWGYIVNASKENKVTPN